MLGELLVKYYMGFKFPSPASREPVRTPAPRLGRRAVSMTEHRERVSIVNDSNAPERAQIVNGSSALERTRAAAQSLSHLVTSFLLEVLGGAGAIWGCSEVRLPRDARTCAAPVLCGEPFRTRQAFNVRAGPNNDAWRVICTVVFLMCSLR